MQKIALIYSFNSPTTALIADKIASAFSEEQIEKMNVETIDENTFMKYDNLILGVPTWFDGELPNYWDEFLPALEDLNLNGKTIALFGTGDQVNYSENFEDGIGILADFLTKLGATIVGETSIEGYDFEGSKALRNDKFLGLAIDQDNQAEKTDERVVKWTEQLMKEFR